MKRLTAWRMVRLGSLGIGGLTLIVTGLNWLLPFVGMRVSPVPNPLGSPIAVRQPVSLVGPMNPPAPGGNKAPDAAPVARNTTTGTTLSALEPTLGTDVQEQRSGEGPKVPPPYPGTAPVPEGERKKGSNPQFVPPPEYPVSPPPPPEDVGSGKPEMTVGETMDVTAKPLRRARYLGTLRYPEIPSETLRSRLSGRVIRCRVTVETNGGAAADCSDNPGIPAFILARAQEELERAGRWLPAMNEKDEPLPDQITVRFEMK